MRDQYRKVWHTLEDVLGEAWVSRSDFQVWLLNDFRLVLLLRWILQ